MRRESNMSQRTAFNLLETKLCSSHLLEASAGTGKTYSITGLYIRLLVEQNLLPENILVVTFTNAATAELKGRIRQRIQETLNWANAHKSKDADFFEPLFNNWLSDLSLTLTDIKQRLITALACFDKAAILTIHSFCQRVLNDYAFEAGGRFDLTMLTDSSELTDTVINDFWRIKIAEASEDKLWVQWLLDEKQSPDVWHKLIKNYLSRPYLEIRSAQLSELTQADTAILDRLNTLQSEVLQIWKTDKTSIINDMQESLASNQLHKASYKLEKLSEYVGLLNNCLSLKLTSRFSELTADEKKFSVLEINAKTKKNGSAIVNEFNNRLATLFETHQQYLDLFVTSFQFRKQMLLVELIEYANTHLQQLKFEQGLLDFDQMLLSVYNALETAQADSLVSIVSGQYKAALIDEFQDTDPLQLQVFDSIFAHEKSQTILFYVGDPKQAIYSFRGADIYAYYQGANNCKNQQTLLTNYRSTPGYVDSVNALFSSKYPAFIDNEIKFDWVASTPKPKLIIEGESDASLQFNLIEDGKKLSKGDCESIAVQYTVQQINNILNKAQLGLAYFLDSNSNKVAVKPSDIAILVPTHKQAQLIAKGLKVRGISSVRQIHDTVLQGDAAQTVLRLLRAVATPKDVSCLMELLGDPLLGISGENIAALKNSANDWELIIEKFFHLNQTWKDKGFSAMFRQWLLLSINGFPTVTQYLVSVADGERLLTDLMHVSEVLQERAGVQTSIKTLVNWLQYALNGCADEDEHKLRLESEQDRVKILTLHAAKGLEFNIVFCPFLWQGKPEITKSKNEVISAHINEQAVVDFGSEQFDELLDKANNEQLMESLRLLYVALTRPVHKCFLVWADVQYHQYIYTANSALAWLLYGDDKLLTNPSAMLRNKVKGFKFADIKQGVINFCETAKQRHPSHIKHNHANVAYNIVSTNDVEKYQAQESIDKQLQISPSLSRVLFPSWYQASFSSLTSGQHASIEQLNHSESDIDQSLLLEVEQENELVDEWSIFNFPRGAMPGECIHSIFEHWDFNSSDEDLLKTLVEDNLDKFAIASKEKRSHWVEPLANNILHTLSKPLNRTGFALKDVAPQDRQAEFQFLLSGRTSIRAIQSIIANPKFTVPAPFVEASKQLEPKHIQGFLVGFIDLVFKDPKGQFHVLDWKSNHLGYSYKEYAPELIEHAMAKTHYYLQAILYLLALHRYLKQQIPDYTIEKHLGGAWYVFARGIDITQDQDEIASGIYQWQPSAELIQDLDKALETAPLQQKVKAS